MMFSELKQRLAEKMGSEAKLVAKPRVVLIDDDPIYCGIMAKTAENLALDFDSFESVTSLEFIRRLSEYDIIIVDQQMNYLSGMEIAAFKQSFFDDKTLVLISASDVTKNGSIELPHFISAFMHKDEGTYLVLKRALSLYVS